jgi:hypothetical protein
MPGLPKQKSSSWEPIAEVTAPSALPFSLPAVSGSCLGFFSRRLRGFCRPLSHNRASQPVQAQPCSQARPRHLKLDGHDYGVVQPRLIVPGFVKFVQLRHAAAEDGIIDALKLLAAQDDDRPEHEPNQRAAAFISGHETQLAVGQRVAFPVEHMQRQKRRDAADARNSSGVIGGCPARPAWALQFRLG